MGIQDVLCSLVRAGLPAVGLPLLLSCTSSPAPEEPENAVAVVIEPESGWPEGRAWTIDADPVLELGRLDADASQAFSDIRGVVRLSDERILVAQASTQDIRAFDASGHHLSTWGGKGGGPSEFRQLDGLYLADGDTVIVYESRGSVVKMFSPEGELGRRTVLSTVPNPHVVGSVAGGLLTTWNASTPNTARETETGVYRADPLPLVIHDRDGKAIREIGMFEGQRVFKYVKGSSRTHLYMLFADRTLLDTRDTTIVAWRYGSDVVEFWPVSSGSVVSARIPWTVTRTTDADIHAYIDRYMIREKQGMFGNPLREEGFEHLFKYVAKPDFRPRVLRDIKVDALGNAWVRRYPDDPSPTATAQIWGVFSPVAGYLGDVAVPGNPRKIYQIDDEFLVAVYSSELDVSTVRVFRVLKP